MTDKRMTAAEILAKLNADPAFVAKQRERDAELMRREAASREAQSPLLADLRAAGFTVSSVWDFVNTSACYTAALPILLSHLSRSYPPDVKEGIARALAVPQTRELGWKLLIESFKHEANERVKDGMAAAIAAAANRTVLADVIALLRDPSHGPSRILLLSAVARSREPSSVTVLEELRTDPELTKEVNVILHRKRGRRTTRQSR